jgi:hypothetical protein
MRRRTLPRLARILAPAGWLAATFAAATLATACGLTGLFGG